MSSFIIAVRSPFSWFSGSSTASTPEFGVLHAATIPVVQRKIMIETSVCLFIVWLEDNMSWMADSAQQLDKVK
jgi:hypothetical protein